MTIIDWLVRILLALSALLAPAAPAHYSLVALGDSLTSGYGNPGAAWPALLSDRWPLLSNAGVVGDTTADMLERFDSDVRPYDPDLVLILGGVNDLSRGVPVASVEANLADLAELALADGIVPVLIAPPHNCVFRIQGDLDALADWLIWFGQQEHLLVIDLRPALDRRHTTDGIHWSAAGTARAAAAIETALDEWWFSR